MDKLTEDFKNSLILSSEAGMEDCLEFGIDAFIEDGVLKEFPIVSTIVSGLKIAKNIYDRNLLKQTLTFLVEFNNGTISKDKLIAYKATIDNNPKKCEDELGRVILLLNQFIDKEKSIILAKIFKAYINNEIDANEFYEYTETINRIYVQDIYILKKIYKDEIKYEDINEKHKLGRLSSIGFLRLDNNSYDYDEKEQSLSLGSPKIIKTEFGEKFLKICY